MAWHREIGLESVDIIVESNNEPGLKSLIASWSTMTAMTSGSRMSAENSPAGSPKSDGIDERAIQSAQGMIRTIRSDIKGLWGGEDQCDACHLAVDCRACGIFIDEVRGWSRWKNPRARVEKQIGKKYKMSFAEGILWKRKRTGGPLWKVTCMWEAGCESDHCGGESKRCVAEENRPNETSHGDGIEATWTWFWLSRGAIAKMTTRWTENVSRVMW